MIVPMVQYFPLYLQMLLSGNFVLWFNPSNEQLASIGLIRYIKDISFLGFAFLWPILLVQTNRHRLIQMALFVIGVELIIVCLGTVGHIKDPVLPLMVAGFRWLLILHGAIGVGFLVIGYQLWQRQETIIVLERVVIGIIMVNFVIVLWEWWQMGGWSGRFSLMGQRLPGLFPNAIVLAQYITGLCLLLQLLPLKRSWLHTLLLVALLTTVISGTRGGLLSILFIWLIVLLTQFRHLIKRLWLLSPLFIIIMIPIMQVVGYVADRGSFFEQQFEPGNRFYNLAVLFDMASRSPLFDVLFGKGLGYGTNTSSVMNVGYSHPWRFNIDSTFATWFLQMGLLGITTLLFIAFLIGVFSFYHSKQDAKKRAVVYTTFFTLLVLSLQQNFFEQYGIMTLLGMVIALLLSKQGEIVTTSYKPILILTIGKNHTN
ncbi:hypothetical protein PN36_27235 [Candidatus Thiomargarita nelsonii]|uniref:O-antigen ligase-related domain-containing protein n=1 Tax=Candidatus Thiomargarita nelsonii TaxID=1003181 RepID=A0A0A6PBW9_9GAMM|nr:hypothetical protein PN36_27235 [Candidatus Thiomargarita nelsonii]